MFPTNDFQVIPKRRPNLFRGMITLMGITFFFGILYLIFAKPIQIDIYFTVFIIGFIGVNFLLTFLDYYNWRLRWQLLADDIILEFHPLNRSLFKRPSLRGNRHGYQSVIETFTRGSGRSKTYYTRIQIQFPFTATGSFSIKKKGLLDGRDVQVDMEAVDKAFTIRTDSTHMVHRIFQTSRLRQSLFDIVAQAKKMELVVSGNALTFHERGRIIDVEYLSALYNFLHKVGESVRQSSLNPPESQEHSS